MSFKITNSFLLFFISILFVFQVVSINAINYTEYPCDHIQSSECTTQNFIIEKQDKQIANLTDKIMGLQNSQDSNNAWKNVGTGFGIIGSIVGS